MIRIELMSSINCRFINTCDFFSILKLKKTGFRHGLLRRDALIQITTKIKLYFVIHIVSPRFSVRDDS